VERRNVNFNEALDRANFFAMCLQRLPQLLLTLFVLITIAFAAPLSLPAQAASSAAIRAYDDADSSIKDYSGQSLLQAEFSNANLKEANFSNADLRGAVFNGSVLANANFHGANFSDGIAYITDFAGADLSDVIFDSAMMLKSNFRGADVTGADFSFALIDREQVLSLCKTARGSNPVTHVDTRESLGCR
jgi:uncharacterized protein YjbI with pentapeptide repeats